MSEELIDIIKSLKNSADILYKTKDFTSATILYFKLLFLVLDHIILKEKGTTPKDHTERFRVLQLNFPSLYLVLDKYYPVYRDTYSLIINKEICDEIKENVNKIIKEYKIDI